MNERDVKGVVRGRYGQIARQDRECCSGCGCGGGTQAQAEAIGYSSEDLTCIPDEALMGLGCGNPTAIAELKEGETVLDLGSGAGVDVFLAADRVGASGKVIGVDMTEEMIERARSIAGEHGYHNVEFRLGEIENLPVGDESVDAIISNCVVNLSPDKPGVFREAWRVLKPGGRLTISDIVSERALPDGLKRDADAWACCIGGALEQQEYLRAIREAGFDDVRVLSSKEFHLEAEGEEAPTKLMSITVKAYR
ncbi:MAG: arsenite methyltransferase [Dehalococcoidia bacterium]